MFGLNKKRITVLYQYSSTVVQKTQVPDYIVIIYQDNH